MTIHYHGLPITPERRLTELGGRHFCISHATQRSSQTATALVIAQSIMFDCGAFTIHGRGGKLDIDEYYSWLAPMLGHPHWAVVPDRIGAPPEKQRLLLNTWPFAKVFGAPVWHLAQPLEYLLELAEEWPRVCFGSSKEFWKIGTAAWDARVREAFTALREADLYPMIHGLRMMTEAERWPFASVDSANVARNWKDRGVSPQEMADRLDRVNGPKRSYYG